MARPQLNRNGLWARIFGKIFGKIVGEIAKVEKNCENFRKIFQKIAEIFQKIVEIFQKIVEKIVETSENFPKPSPPTYKSARNLKVFFAHCLTRSLSHKIILFLLLFSFLPNNSSDLSFRCQKTLNFSERVYLCLSLLLMRALHLTKAI